LRKYADIFDKKYVPLTKSTLGVFHSYHWPGNVRELENIIKKIVVLENQESALQDIGIVSKSSAAEDSNTKAQTQKFSLKKVGKMAAQEAEKQLILDTLLQTRWNRKKAADLLDISYKALLYKIKQSGISKRRISA